MEGQVSMKRSSLLIVMVLTLLISAVGTVAASEESTECETAGPDGVSICGEILDHWNDYGGPDTYGYPLAPAADELNSDTDKTMTVQYFAHARLEIHPEFEGTPYYVQAGRLGAELLAKDGIDWRDFDEGDPDDPTWSEPTGQSIAPEFQEYWESTGTGTANGLDAFQSSLALFGYPISPAEYADDDETLIQWFERSRLEMDADGNIAMAPLGDERVASTDQPELAFEEFDTRLQEILDEHGDTGIGAWMESSEFGDFEWQAGVANDETDEPYTLETHHRVGSVTKPLTALVVLDLVEEGLLDLDDPVDQWFPELDGSDEVTVRMLGNMTSGIYSYTDTIAWLSATLEDPEQEWDPEDLLWYGFEMTDTAEPDGSWHYSNTNYIMLGLIVEELTGDDFGTALEERVLQPLGLDHTSFPDDGEMPEPYARALYTGSPAAGEQDSTNWHPSVSWTAGQVISTAGDMLQYAPELAESQLLSDDVDAERLSLIQVVDDDEWDVEAMGDEPPGYGFGVMYSDGWYTHNGVLFGYTTMVAYHPGYDVSLVVFGNGEAIGPDGTIATFVAFAEITELLEDADLD
ncbi:MAG: class A beta-lactamase-related serine hydrolase [Sphaerobacteraceae bacterium]|nr:MAG: class A beta-lactamase-related serine hydrolase [Sphaerobacteraceae bacterium]